MKSSYYIACHTRELMSPDAYKIMAGKMVNLLHSVFGNAEQLTAITHKKSPDGWITTAHSEVQIAHDEYGLVGRIVVDLTAEGRVILDKSKLSALLRATSEWPALKIEKRQVEAD